MSWFKKRWDAAGSAALIGTMISIVILVVIGAVLFPLVNDKISDLTNASHEDYVGADTESIVSMIPIFYWLMIALVIIGAAIAVFRTGL